MLVFYFFAAIAIWFGVLSLRGGHRFWSYVRRETALPLPTYTPFVSVIAPFRGLDQGLKENLTALFEQSYPAYEIILVTDRPDDPALAVVEEVRTEMSDKLQFVADVQNPLSSELISDLRRHMSLNVDDNLKIVGRAREGPIASRVVIAGEALESGQKVHNLRTGVANSDPKAEVLVFVDSDARPHGIWLRSLVAPLVDETLGAASGYRWFIPAKGALASQLRAVWNASIASALGAQSDKNFCWGGSTAIRCSTFANLKVAERWRGTVSDDFTLTRVLQEAQLPIHFVPHCLMVSFDDCGFRELLEFTTRQLKITRVYAAHLWKAILLGSFLFVIVFFGGIGLVIVRALLGLPVGTALVMLLIIFILGAAKAWIRLRAVDLALANYNLSPAKSNLAHLFLWPFASVLFLINALAAAFSRRIKWRGISYELKSPTEAVIIGRESERNA